MDWAEYEDDQKTLKGIAALLLGLAVLAGLAYFLPLSLRTRMLEILRPAEAAARAYVVEETRGAVVLPAVPVPGEDGDSRSAALHLARCFRALACFFCGLRAIAGGQRTFRSGLQRRLAHHEPTIAWRGNFMTTRRAMALRGAVCLDTS